MKNQQVLQNLCGTVEHVVYQNQDTGFAVIDLVCDGEQVSVVGILSGVQQGEELSMMGYYTTHPVHGHQFKAETCEHRMPQTVEAICKYLASGVVKGIGPAMARRIVDQFGEDTLLVIEREPHRLCEVRGITLKRCEQLAEEFKQVFGIRYLMLYLSKYGIIPAQAVQVWKKWGVLAQDLIQQNPYLLCTREIGISFSIADRIAQDVGVQQDAQSRVLAGLSYTLLYNLNNGHTCLPADKLLAATEKLLGIPSHTLQDLLDNILEQNLLIRVHKNKDYLSLPHLYEAEQYIASRITLMLSHPPQEEPNLDMVIQQIEQSNGLTYDTLQRKAMISAVQNNLFILTGGPGTGKTTTLNGMIELMEQSGLDVCLTAPTGRAAKRMSQLTQRDAKTIHRLLEGTFQDGKIQFAKNEQELLKHDVIVIDEMSMVDTLLFDALLRATKPSAKIVLVGDYNQRATRSHVKSMSVLVIPSLFGTAIRGRTYLLSSRMMA